MLKLSIAHALYPHKRRNTIRPRTVDTLRKHLDLKKIGQGAPSLPTQSGAASISTTPGLTPTKSMPGSISFSKNLAQKSGQPGEFKGITTPKQLKPKGPKPSDLGVPPPVPTPSTAAVPNVSDDTSKLGQFGGPQLQQNLLSNPQPSTPPPVQPAQPPTMPIPQTPQYDFSGDIGQLAQSGAQEAGLDTSGGGGEAPPSGFELAATSGSDYQPAWWEKAIMNVAGNVPGGTRALEWMGNNPEKAYFGLLGASRISPAIQLARAGSGIGGAAGGAMRGLLGGKAAPGAIAKGLGGQAASRLMGGVGAATLGADIGGHLGAKFLYPHIKTRLNRGEVWADQPMTSQEVEKQLGGKYIPGMGAAMPTQGSMEGRAGVGSWIGWVPGLSALSGAREEDTARRTAMMGSTAASHMVSKANLGGFSMPANMQPGSKDYWQKVFQEAAQSGKHIPPEIYGAAMNAGYDPGEIPQSEVEYWTKQQQDFLRKNPEWVKKNPKWKEFADVANQQGQGHGTSKVASLTDHLRLRRMEKSAGVFSWLGKQVPKLWRGGGARMGEEAATKLLRNEAADMGRTLTTRRLSKLTQQMAETPTGGSYLGRAGRWLTGRGQTQTAKRLLTGKPLSAWRTPIGRMATIGGAAVAYPYVAPALGTGAQVLATMPSEEQMPGASFAQRALFGYGAIRAGRPLIEKTDLAKTTGLPGWILESMAPYVASKGLSTITGEGPGLESLLQSPWAAGIAAYLGTKAMPSLKVLGGDPWMYALGAGALMPSLAGGQSLFGRMPGALTPARQSWY